MYATADTVLTCPQSSHTLRSSACASRGGFGRKAFQQPAGAGVRSSPRGASSGIDVTSLSPTPSLPFSGDFPSAGWCFNAFGGEDAATAAFDRSHREPDPLGYPLSALRPVRFASHRGDHGGLRRVFPVTIEPLDFPGRLSEDRTGARNEAGAPCAGVRLADLENERLHSVRRNDLSEFVPLD
jgi:hypothetical protein